MLYKGLSTNSGHYISMVKTLVTFGLRVMILKPLKSSLTISVTVILVICYFTKEAHDENI